MITHRVNKLLLFFNLIEEKECENGVHFFVCADIDKYNKLLLFFNLIEEKECENGVHFFVCADIDKYNKLLLFFNLLVQFIPSLFEFVAFIR